MATYTGNLNLKKPDQSDKIRIADFNGNSDAIDAAIGGDFGVGSNPSIDDAVNSMAEGLAIISNGNTHAAITSGQYVYVRGHGTLAEGLYVATASIAQNGTLSVNNVSAVSGGVLNELDNKIDYSTVINLQQITSSYVTRDTYNNRKFSDYKMLVFTPYENNWARASCIVPTYVFENATGIDIRYYQGGNLIEVDVKRVSDTSYDAKYIGSPPSGEGVFIYCFGLLGK